jgi:hypothetical protein
LFAIVRSHILATNVKRLFLVQPAHVKTAVFVKMLLISVTSAVLARPHTPATFAKRSSLVPAGLVKTVALVQTMKLSRRTLVLALLPTRAITVKI